MRQLVCTVRCSPLNSFTELNILLNCYTFLSLSLCPSRPSSRLCLWRTECVRHCWGVERQKAKYKKDKCIQNCKWMSIKYSESTQITFTLNLERASNGPRIANRIWILHVPHEARPSVRHSSHKITHVKCARSIKRSRISRLDCVGCVPAWICRADSFVFHWQIRLLSNRRRCYFMFDRTLAPCIQARVQPKTAFVPDETSCALTEKMTIF